MNDEKKLFKLLDKFCTENAELSTKELHQLFFLLGNEGDDDRITQWMHRRWEQNPEGFDEMNYDRVFDCVKQQIEQNRTEQSNERLSFMQFFQRCAAVLLLPLLGLSAYLITSDRYLVYTEIVEVLAPSGTQSRITLPDGSTVLLLDDSQIDLSSDFLRGNTREISLVGEAFFDVATDPQRPFIIHTGRIQTTALGTAFTVRAMPGETSITVTVVDGKVKVKDGSKLLTTLEANQQFIYGIETDLFAKQMIETETTEELETMQKPEEGRQPHLLIFRNMLFGDIVQDLAMRYGVNIVVENEELKWQRIDALLDSRNTINILLEFLCALKQVSYTVEGQMFVIR